MDNLGKKIAGYWRSNAVAYSTIVLVVFIGYASVFFYSLSIAHTHGVSTTHFLTFSEGDAHEYYVLGHVLHDTGRFSLTATSSPEYFRTPGYPLFIAVILSIFKNDLAVPLAQIVLVALSALCLFALGEKIFSRGVGVVATILYILNPMTITQSFRTTTETLFVCVLIGAVFVLMRKEPTRRATVAGGALLGFLALVRPIGLFIIPLFLLWIVLVYRKRWNVMIRHGLLFMLGVAMVLLPWLYRNEVYARHFSLSSISTYNMLFYNVLEFEHQRTGISKDILHAQMVQRIGSSDTDQQFRSFAYTEAEQQAVKEYLTPHLVQYGVFHLYTTIPFLFGSDFEDAQRSLHLQGVLPGDPIVDVNLSALLRQGQLHSFISTISLNPLALIERIGWMLLLLSSFCMVSILVSTRSKKSLLVLFLFALPLLLALLTGPVSSPRYRMPAAPFLIMLGVAGIHFLVGYWRNRSAQRIVNTTPVV